MIKEAIIQLAAKQDLSYETAAAVMDEIMSGQASQIQMASFLTALAIKGETIDEITACAAGMRAHCVRLLHDVDALEIVGTGGDGANSFNISTTSAFVIAAGGVPVAKHGNRAASSKSGAADVLEALGINIALSPEQSAELLRRQNFCFLFAQNYHISMKYVAPVRKELGIRTVFNILGPLSNPSRARAMLVGVYSPALTEVIAGTMMNLGVERGMVVSGEDNMDEITLTGETTVSEIKDGKVTTYTITPEQFGLKQCEIAKLQGGDGAVNAQITRDILSGKEQGPKREIVLLNAGAALYIGKKADSIADGIALAAKTIDSGAAVRTLEAMVQATNA